MKKTGRIFSLIIMVMLMVGGLVGCSVSEDEYKEQMGAQIEVYSKDMDNFSEKFGELGFGNEQWMNEMEEYIKKVTKHADTIKKMRAPEKYAGTQEKAKEASQKINEAMTSYESFVFDIKDNSDLFNRDAEVSAANDNLKEANKLLKEVKKEIK